MKNWFSQFLAETTPLGRNAFRVAFISLLAAISGLPVLIYAGAQSGAWQVYALLVSTLGVGIAAAFSAWFARQNRVGLAVGLILCSAALIIPLNAALLSGVGLVLGITGFLIIAAIGGQTLPGRQASSALLVGGATAFLTILIDVFATWERVSIPLLRSAIPAITVGIVVVFGLFLARQYKNYSLRTKLLAAFLLVALIPLGIMAFLNNRGTSQNLTANSDAALQGVASQTAAALDTFMVERLNDVRTEALRHILAEFLTLPVSERSGSETASALNTDLLAMARRDQTFITSVGLLDKNGLSVADTEPAEVGIDKSDRNYFIGARDNQVPYVSPVEISPTTGALSIYFSTPVRDSDGEFIGVLRIRYDASVIQTIVRNSAEQANLSSLSLVVLDENHVRLAHNLAPELIFKSVVPLPVELVTKLQAENRLPANKTSEELSTNIPAMEDGLNNFEQDPFFVAEFHDVGEGDEEGTAVRLRILPWIIAAGQDQDVYLAPLTEQARTNSILAFIIAGIVAVAAVIVAQTISDPVARLTAVAEQIAAGDNTAVAKVETGDEIGTLAKTFNQMTAQLGDFITTLEDRVSARTRDLETVADVSTATATILESKRLLQEVVDLTKERFYLYHAHIYLLDEKGQNLVLTAGAGEPGRIMAAEGRSIPLNREQSLVARAARERKGVTVNDVTQAPDFLPNPLLPDTRSELAVPMIVGGNVIGVFDIQSEQAGRFTESDVNIQTTLAAQLAVSIQNVRSFEQSRKQAELESMANMIGQRIQRAASIEETLQTAIRELGTAVGASRGKVSISAQKDGSNN
jgi:putative methionine-R-sulfoxide reductase with GAF domain